MRLRLESGEVVKARIKGKRIKPVCGDFVQAEPIENESDWLITSIDERQNELTRPNMRGQIEVLAANIDTLVVVASVSPLPDWFIVDRYLCAAELMGVNPILIFNKIDLLAGHGITIPELQEYRDIGIPVFECSAEKGKGIRKLRKALSGQRTIVVGQSGVGKSSLINKLIDESQQRTANISSKTGEGKHTTVNSIMLDLPGGGHVIDSPGVRDFAPALASDAEVIRGFREIENAGHDCRFANCRHMQEPGCAVKAAVESGTISERRYESYRRLLRLTANPAAR